MSSQDWKWKIGEAVERLRTRYEHIGRKTGYPFLALVYPCDAEQAVLSEWRTQTEALRPDIDVRTVDVLRATQRKLDEIGAEEIVEAITNPLPGSNPASELGDLWAQAVVEEVRAAFSRPATGKPVIALERLAALHPAAGPRDVMQKLWDSSQAELDGPLVVLIPGRLVEARTYLFVEERSEFMYRGDVL
ncbi:MAG: hypothetical protein RBU45_06050 [Myxococcota bacterium]|jgi:hypothetical protein|nr:hypothetical protein [Myxococcota bacterium]